MKKTISLVLILVFASVLIIGLPVLADENTTTTTRITTTLEKSTPLNLEKIPSPEKMNLYREIKKVGNDLFGIRKASSTIANITKNDDKKASSTLTAIQKKIQEAKKSGLEKISSLDQIKLFEKITKIGNDLFGIKKKGVTVLPAMDTETVTCVSSAIDAKDTSVGAALTDSAVEINKAINTRNACQKNVLTLTSERESALKTCNKIFQETAKTINEKAKKTQQEAWNTYKKSLKSCSTTTNTAEITIEDGGDILK